LAAWLCTIARNLVHRSHRKLTIVTEPLIDETGGLASAALAPDAELLRQEQSDFVWSAIGEIDEKHRETLVLYYRGGQSVRDIASATESTEEAVRQRLVRARKSLKAKLEEMVGTILTDTAPGEAFTLTVMTALGAAMLTASTAQAAVATGTVATGATTGGKALGTATIGSFLMPAAFWGWFVAFYIALFWTGVRNAPTLRSRRYRVYSIFWSLQYFVLFCLAFGILFAGSIQLFFPKGSGGPMVPFLCVLMGPLALFVMYPMQKAYHRKMKSIIENDLGLPGEYVESYSYPQVERRFFLSLITNLLLAETIIAFLVIATLSDGSYSDPKFLPGMFVGIIVVAIIAALYYPLGRYFLKICSTKQEFLAASPLIDDPFEVVLQKTIRPPEAMDHPENAKGLFGVQYMVKIGLLMFAIWYFSHYSWDKHPILLGICAALIIGVGSVPYILFKKMKGSQAWFLNALSSLCMVGLMLAMEYIEFGSVYAFSVWTHPTFPPPNTMICAMHLSLVFFMPIAALASLLRWFQFRREEGNDKSSGREELLQEAIARFDPATMTEDEPEVAAKPFPKHWLWILGLYAAAIVVLFCLGVLIPNSYAKKKMLERNNDYTALIELEPDNAKWYYMRAIYAPYGRMEDLDMAIRLKPDYASAYNQRAQARIHQASGIVVDVSREDCLLALDDINEAIRFEPNECSHLMQRAWIYARFDDDEAAERDFSELIRRMPNSRYYGQRANFFDYTKKDLQAALTDYTTAIECAQREKSKQRYPEYPLESLYQDRGRLYEKLGETEKATADFERAQKEK
jgi:tetratricopeptide (TPR) repeat protein